MRRAASTHFCRRLGRNSPGAPGAWRVVARLRCACSGPPRGRGAEDGRGGPQSASSVRSAAFTCTLKAHSWPFRRVRCIRKQEVVNQSHMNHGARDAG